MFVGCLPLRLYDSASCLWWNLGKDKTLGRCDGAAKWRIRMGVGAVVHVHRAAAVVQFW